jgi:hypothetical protein
MEHGEGLRDLVQALPERELVVTSTHREGRDAAGLRALLPPDIAEAVVSATPVTALGRAARRRQDEIETWLQMSLATVVWAAVDDEAAVYQQGCTWLVLTSKWVG